MLRVLTYCYYETKDYSKGLDAVAHLFRVLSPDKRVSKDWEYYGKLLIAGGNDSLGIGQLQKAFELEPSRIDILYDIANTWMNLKQYTKAIEAINQKISSGKDVKVLDYFTLGQAYYFNRQFAEADSAVAKANELSPKWPSAWLYRAKINAQIDSTSEGGLAKPFYEKFIETALTDSLKPDFGAKYNNRLVEAYGYLAYYYILKKDYTNGLLYLKKKLELPLEPEEKKKIEKAIDQIEHPSPKNEKK